MKMFKDTKEGQTNYCTHVISQEDGYCHRCFGKDLEASSNMSQQEQSWEINLAEEGTPLAEFQKIRTRAVCEMLDDNQDEILQTSRLYSKLDACFSSLFQKEREKMLNALIKSAEPYDNSEWHNQLSIEQIKKIITSLK